MIKLLSAGAREAGRPNIEKRRRNMLAFFDTIPPGALAIGFAHDVPPGYILDIYHCVGSISTRHLLWNSQRAFISARRIDIRRLHDLPH